MREHRAGIALTIFLLLTPGAWIAAGDAKPVKESSIQDELLQVEEAWTAAIVKNDADAIGGFMTDDWVLIGRELEVRAHAPHVHRREVS